LIQVTSDIIHLLKCRDFLHELRQEFVLLLELCGERNCRVPIFRREKERERTWVYNNGTSHVPILEA
jgi:hypothetical protein